MARRNRPPLPRMPDQFRDLADEAIARHHQRGLVPEILMGENVWVCPYAKEDEDRWTALLFEIFGTRQGRVVSAFSQQLENIGTRVWTRGHAHTKGRWHLENNELTQMLAIILSLKPQDEAQAAYAAQLVALHLSAMKLSSAQASTWGGDPRTAAILNKTVNAYGLGLERMRRLQGKVEPRQTHQTIEVHYHDNRQTAVFNGGVPPNGSQPHGTNGGEAIPRTALPRPQSGGEALPSASGEGQAGMQSARGWWGRAKRRAQRLLEAW